eukprot:XP_014066191.1 PREDICTED: sacsin-like isoform X2 [Salmo salar]
MSLSKRKTRHSFGATAPPFIDYLKDILRRYPDGGQILKELIQNADDAGASEVVFLHDERCYGRQSLKTEGLGKYQGTLCTHRRQPPLKHRYPSHYKSCSPCRARGTSTSRSQSE